MKLSKSKILDYMNCSRLFYFKYLTSFGKDKKQSSPELERGSILHEIFEAYNTDEKKYKMYCDFVEDRPDYAMNVDGFHALLNHYGLERAEHSELRVYHEGINISGILDAIYYVPDYDNLDECGFPKIRIVLIDYKTGKFKKYKMAEYRMELYIYEALANYYLNDKYGTENVQYIDEIGMLFTSEPIESSFIEPVVDFKRKNAMNKFNKLKDGIERGDFTKVGRFCKTCAFRVICDDYSDDMVTKLDDHVLYTV